jgi:hypothetical protein
MAYSRAKMNPKLLEEVYNFLITKFQVTDMDQDVEDKTTYGIGFFVSSFGDSLGSSRLSLLADRLSYEISRQSALKALTLIARFDKDFSFLQLLC